MKDLENKLFRLFDFQRYEKNKALQSIISDAEDRHDQALLSDAQLSYAIGGKKEEEIKKDLTDE